MSFLKKENALSFDQVEQMLFNFMKQKQTWKSNYSTVRLFILVWSSLNFPSVFFCIIDCMIWLVGRFWCTFDPLFSLYMIICFLIQFQSVDQITAELCWLWKASVQLKCPTQWRIQTFNKGGPGHPDPEIRGGRLQKNFFRLFVPQSGLIIRGTSPLGHLP